MQAQEYQHELEKTHQQLDHGTVEPQANMLHEEFKSPEELTQVALSSLQEQDLEIVRQSLTILTEIHLGACELKDMQGELPTEITQTCLIMRKNMAKLVQAKSLFA